MITLEAVLNKLNDLDESSIQYPCGLFEFDSEQLFPYLTKQIATTKNINSINDIGATALTLAAASNLYDLTELLIEAGAKINHKDNSGYTALSWACITDNTEIVSLLIEQGADLFLTHYANETDLVLIARFTGNVEIAKILIDAAAQKDPFNELHGALVYISEGPCETVYTALDNKIAINNALLQTLSARLFYEPIELIKLMINAQGFNPQNSIDGGIGDIMLNHSIIKGYKDLIPLLIEAGVDIHRLNYCNTTPLIRAIEYNQPEIERILLNAGADFTVRPSIFTKAFWVVIKKKWNLKTRAIDS